jgi:hypothetical protein
MPPEDEKQPERDAEDGVPRRARGHDGHCAKGAGRRGRADHHAAAEPARIQEHDSRSCSAWRSMCAICLRMAARAAFDTVGASLFMSGDQIEQYLALGRRALDEHFARAAMTNEHRSRHARRLRVLGNQRMNGLFTRTKEQHDNYVKWTTAVDAAAKRPENIVASPKSCARRRRSPVRPPACRTRRRCCFTTAGRRSKARHRRRTSVSADAQKAFFDELQYINHFAYYTDYQKLPGRESGAWLLFYQAYRETYVEAGPKWPSGRYTLRMRVAANETPCRRSGALWRSASAARIPACSPC